MQLFNTYQVNHSSDVESVEINGENIIKVSPYKVQNLTGYNINVQRDFTEQ